MSDQKTEKLTKTVERFGNYYNTFLEDGSCKAIKARALLEEIAALTIKIERDIYIQLIELGHIAEVKDFLEDEYGDGDHAPATATDESEEKLAEVTTLYQA